MMKALLNKSALSNVALGLAGVAIVSTMVVRSSTAAFTATTDTTGSWDAGTVSLTDNDGGNASFTVAKMTPTESGSKCLDVTYAGNADVNAGQTVKLYTSALTDTDGTVHNTNTSTHLTLSDDLTVTVSVYDAGQTCAANTTAPAQKYTGTLADIADAFGTTAIDSGWTPNPETGTDTARAFKIDYLLPGTTGNDAQGDGVDATFTWEIRSNA